MKTLDQFNRDRRKEREIMLRPNEPHPNGIECPSCRAELWDTSPLVMLASNPPQKNIHCPSCGFKGYRIA